MLWGLRVVKGGFIAGHDLSQARWGVEKAVVEFCKDDLKWEKIPQDCFVIHL
jgi:hypothetical protein